METPCKSQRLFYRPLKASDQEITHQIFSDPQNLGGHNLPHHSSLEETALIHADIMKNSLLSLIICLPSTTSTPAPIGILTLTTTLSICYQNQTNLGIAILSSHQRRGYGTEAINWILERVFLTMGLSVIALRCLEYNFDAIKLYCRLGFRKIYVSEKVAEWKGKKWDIIELGMTREQWTKREKRKEVERRRNMDKARSKCWGLQLRGFWPKIWRAS